MNDARQAFGSALRSHREQQGIPLSAIADATKISTGLLAALERGDLSRWPNGIFRRAFFRDYVAAIGLSPDRLIVDFVRIFPDETVVVPPQPDAELRLALVQDDRPNVAALKRVALVLGELLAVMSSGALTGWMLGVDVWYAVGAMALAYYPISNLCVERRRLRTAQPLGTRLRRALRADTPAASTDETPVLEPRPTHLDV